MERKHEYDFHDKFSYECYIDSIFESLEKGRRKTMTATIYRCAACKKGVEVEVDYVEDREEGTLITDIKPCEVCIRVAEEGVREESYDKGYQEGWQAGYDTVLEEVDIERDDP